jgi:2-polyprenyl-3-methyl-5-hydroxy-6-metoxy-1,4-benzoquinol methylase
MRGTFHSREFDLIVAFDVLEHIEDDETVLSQLFQGVHSGWRRGVNRAQHRWLWSRTDDFARYAALHAQRIGAEVGAGWLPREIHHLLCFIVIAAYVGRAPVAQTGRH